MQPSRLGLTLTSGKAIHWCNAPASDQNADQQQLPSPLSAAVCLFNHTATIQGAFVLGSTPARASIPDPVWTPWDLGNGHRHFHL